MRNWVSTITYFRTGVKNFFDHDVIGNSNIFLPLTIDSARIRGVEVAVARLWFSVAITPTWYTRTSRPKASVVSPADLPISLRRRQGGFYLDHDQRNTLSAGIEGDLPWHSFAAFTVNYGSGFLNGDGPDHCPATLRSICRWEKLWENHRAPLRHKHLERAISVENSNTFGGSHWADPAMVSVQIKYRFHY